MPESGTKRGSHEEESCGFRGAGVDRGHVDCNKDWGAQMFYRPASTPEEVGRLRTMLSPNRCVEISGANWWQGANVQLWDCNGGNHQYWNAP